MKTVTIDASCAISWLFAEQRTASADALLLNGAIHRVAPDIFAWEVGNFIAVKSSRGHVDLDGVREKLDRLDIRIGWSRDKDQILSLIGPAIAHGLSLFDTAYLLHALGHGGSLASRDGRLLDAARAVGVDVFDLRG
ncbi:type II toxin-antitoxin system VapC family toxin [Brevundimonas sp.]|uniref:type II toxin-antitoxin system VapC family toxin n=1 Tax=Brevundimonas sp. TaxID=1871086 RepID=UPI002AB84563|nr:type II toxin-antitoxin system VapC family toxin [Brevundimonas sp.]MDZ4362180.1 type II toxin-antitoxin system VapC family toxin [Brevundimonas sp.]